MADSSEALFLTGSTERRGKRRLRGILSCNLNKPTLFGTPGTKEAIPDLDREVHDEAPNPPLGSVKKIKEANGFFNIITNYVKIRLKTIANKACFFQFLGSKHEYNFCSKINFSSWMVM